MIKTYRNAFLVTVAAVSMAVTSLVYAVTPGDPIITLNQANNSQIESKPEVSTNGKILQYRFPRSVLETACSQFASNSTDPAAAKKNSELKIGAFAIASSDSTAPKMDPAPRNLKIKAGWIGAKLKNNNELFVSSETCQKLAQIKNDLVISMKK